MNLIQNNNYIIAPFKLELFSGSNYCYHLPNYVSKINNLQAFTLDYYSNTNNRKPNDLSFYFSTESSDGQVTSEKSMFHSIKWTDFYDSSKGLWSYGDKLDLTQGFNELCFIDTCKRDDCNDLSEWFGELKLYGFALSADRYYLNHIITEVSPNRREYSSNLNTAYYNGSAVPSVAKVTLVEDPYVEGYYTIYVIDSSNQIFISYFTTVSDDSNDANDMTFYLDNGYFQDDHDVSFSCLAANNYAVVVGSYTSYIYYSNELNDFNPSNSPISSLTDFNSYSYSIESDTNYFWGDISFARNSSSNYGFAAFATGGLYMTENSGVNWVKVSNVTVYLVAANLNGNCVLFADRNTVQYGCYEYEFYSKILYNSNATIQAIAIDGSGQYIVIAKSDYQLAISHNYGSTWFYNNDFNLDSSRIAIDITGKFQILTVGKNWIYKSSDYGSSWQSLDVPQYSWFSVTLNNAGSLMIATSSEGVYYMDWSADNSTSSPTVQPIISPTVAPTILPTKLTDKPVTSPTAVPTGIPTAVPTGIPTAVPTGIPTTVPTGIPVTAPTGPPTAVPTEIPIASPTVSPTELSRIKTEVPSNSPSIIPSSFPSFNPTLLPSNSVSPTIIPSSTPSLFPTFRPSQSPTIKPTLAPTRKPNKSPTAQPTSQPSYLISDYQTLSIYKKLVQYKTLVAASHSDYYSFLSFYYKGTFINGTCSDWSKFISSSLSLPFSNQYFSALTAYYSVYDHSDGSTVFHNTTCHDSNAIATITDAVTSRVSSSVSCNNIIWRIKVCSNNVIVCVNCESSCSSTSSCPGNKNVDLALGSCQSCTYRTASFSYFIADISSKDLFPKIGKPLVATTTKTTADVTVNVTSSGNIYCAALTPSFNLSSPYYLKQVGSSGSVTSSGGGEIVITLSNLIPAKTYEIYCYTEDFTNNFMPLSLVKSTKLEITTSCCRNIKLTSYSNVLREYNSLTSTASPTKFTFAIDYLPTNSLTIKVSAIPYDDSCEYSSQEAANMTITPRIFTFTSTSLSTSNSFIISKSLPGCYSISFDSSLSSYVNYNATNIFIYGSATPPPAPELQSVVFSNDGRQLYVQFDSPTDYGVTILKNYAGTFSCATLIYFESIGQSNCIWISSGQMILVTLDSTSTVNIGNFVNIVTNTIKAVCPSGVVCNSYSSSSIKLAISAPTTAIKPTVSLSTSPSVSSCDYIQIDPTNSKGFAGRPWQSVEWSVVSPTVPIANTTVITNYLNSYYQTTNQLIVIPNSILLIGSYSISLQLTNFLSQSAIASVTTTVKASSNIPRVSISGPSSITTFRNQSLSIIALATIPSCDGSNSLTVGLYYQWFIYKGTTLLSLQSTSLDPKIFSLRSFTLDSATSYTVQVAVSTTGSVSGSSSASVSVQVGQSAGVKAVIRGGSQRTVTKSVGSVTIDASDSTVLDYPAASNLLSYSWTCLDNTPSNYGGSCPFSGLSSSTSSSITITVSSLTIGSLGYNVYRFSVLASYNGQSSLADTVLYVKKNAIPVVAFGSIKSIYNPTDNIVLTGEITATSNNASAYWFSSTLNDSNVQLSSIVSTPTYYSSLPSSSSGVTSIVQISITSNYLTPGSSYVFHLTSAYVNTPAFEASAQVTITINSPPSGGSFIVDPTNGTALSTSYKCVTYLWSDDVSDYPLTYVMVYFSNPEDPKTRNTIKSVNEITYAVSTLGQGLVLNDYNVSVVTIVYDTYNCSSNITNYIQVYPTVANKSELYNYLSDSLTTAFLVSDSDSVSSTLNGVLKSTNLVDCSLLAPEYCYTLNRYQCGNQANTCGECIDGYIGKIGYSNTPCYSSFTIKPVGGTCAHNYDCLTNHCANGICSYTNKSCPSDCNSNLNQGECVFENINNNTIRESQCLENDITCMATCVCNNDFYGSDCSYDYEDFQALLNTRESMCVGLYDSISIQDVSYDAIISRAVIASNILFDTTQLTQNALEHCVLVLIDTVTNYPSAAGLPNVQGFITTTLSNILSVKYLADLPSISGDSTSTTLLQDVINTISALGSGIQANKAIGEAPTKTILPYLKSTSTVQDPCSSNSIGLTVPQSDYELYNNEPTNQVSASTSGNCGSSNGVGVNIFQNIGPTSGSLKSTPIGVQTSNYDIDAYGSRRLTSSSYSYTFTFANTESITYTTLADIIYGNYTCEINSSLNSYNVTLNCTNTDIEYQLYCPGDELRVYEYECPGLIVSPQCVSSTNGYDFSADSNCEVIEYTSENTTCTCTSSSSSRKLSLSRSSSSESSQFSTSTNIVVHDFINRWKTVKSFNASTVSQNLVITITMAVVIFVTLAGVFSFIFVDIREDKFKPKAEIMKRKKIGTKVKNFFNSLLPIEFTGQPWFTRYFKRMKLEHDWLCLFLPYSSDRDYRSVRWVRAMGRVLHMLFIDTILSGLFFADDGTCENYTSKSTCLATSSLDQINTLCVWDSSDGCSFNSDIGSSVFTTLLLTTIITIITIPFDTLFYFMLRKAKDLAETKARALNTVEIIEAHDKFDVPLSAGLHNLQTMKSKFYRAALLSKHQKTLSLSVDEEIRLILQNIGTLRNEMKPTVANVVNVAKVNNTLYSRPTEQEQTVYQSLSKVLFEVNYLLDEPADPLEIADTLNRYNNTPQSLQSSNISTNVMKSKIKESRKQCDVVLYNLNKLESNEMKDIYLLQQFLVNCLSGLKRKIAYRYFFHEIERKNNIENERKLQIICIILLPIYLFGLAFYIFLFGVSIGSKATNIWLLGSFISLLQSILIIQPLKIWLQFVVLSTIADEVRIWHGLLREKARTIMSRSSGLLSNKNVLIQHLNPACRAACSYPSLPSSRLIMAINDYDLPTSRIISNMTSKTFLSKITKYMFLTVVISLFILTLLPDFLQESAMEGITTPVIGIVILVLAYSSRKSVLIPIVISCGFIVLVTIRELYEARKRRHAKSIVQPVVLPQDEIGTDLDELDTKVEMIPLKRIDIKVDKSSDYPNNRQNKKSVVDAYSTVISPNEGDKIEIVDIHDSPRLSARISNNQMNSFKQRGMSMRRLDDTNSAEEKKLEMKLTSFREEDN